MDSSVVIAREGGWVQMAEGTEETKGDGKYNVKTCIRNNRHIFLKKRQSSAQGK